MAHGSKHFLYNGDASDCADWCDAFKLAWTLTASETLPNMDAALQLYEDGIHPDLAVEVYLEN